MRFMMLLKGDANTEAGKLPTQEELEAMAKYNEELVNAGVMLDGAGLKPTSAGAKVIFEGGKPRVVDGPFTETKEILAGYWMIQVGSKEEAIEWALRCPFKNVPGEGRAPEIELRPVYELEDFEPSDALEHHRRLQERMAGSGEE